MDYVIAFVDSNTPGWEEEAEKYAIAEHDAGSLDDDLSGPCRYRKIVPVRLQVELIRKFMPFINKIFITVPNKEHLAAEDFSGLGDVIIVENKDHIPEEFLPTFNAFVVEYFLDRIPGLSDEFIYSNDDVYVSGPLSRTNFIKDDGTIILGLEAINQYEQKIRNAEDYNDCCARTQLIATKLATGKNTVPTRLMRAQHIPHIFIKKYMEEARLELEASGLKMDLSRFRNYCTPRGNLVTLSPPTFFSVFEGLKSGKYRYRMDGELYALSLYLLSDNFPRVQNSILHPINKHQKFFVFNDMSDGRYSMYKWAKTKLDFKTLLEKLLKRK